MALDLQAKLLRVLETREFYKVGDSKPVKVNIRIIAATNRDLEKNQKKEPSALIYITGYPPSRYNCLRSTNAGKTFPCWPVTS